jgi:uncharacterized membrane protein
MKHLSQIIFLICAAIFIVVTILDYQQLPARVASHFNASNVADGWSSKATFTFWMIVLGFGIPAFAIGIMSSIRLFPLSLVNLPHPEYWKRPENYPRACDHFLRSALWFGSAFLLWQAALFHTVATANHTTPPRLDGDRVMLLTALLLAFTGLWLVALILPLFRVGRAGK